MLVDYIKEILPFYVILCFFIKKEFEKDTMSSLYLMNIMDIATISINN